MDPDQLKGTFSVISYNILSESYSIGREELPQVLGRNNLILKELDLYNGDIICLQEVEKKVYENILCEYFEERDYDHHFYLKGRAREKLTPTNWIPNVDGCVIAFRRSKFSALEFKDIELRQVLFDKGVDKFGLNRATFQKVLSRDQIMTVAILETTHKNSPKKKLCVANTHLMYSAIGDTLSTIQAHCCTHTLTKIMEEREPMGLIFCGDFNASPRGGTYKYLKDGIIEHKSIWLTQNNKPVTDRDLTHSLELKSAYGQSSLGEPSFTMYRDKDTKSTVDYIWYNPLLKLSKVLKIDEQNVLKHKRLPSIIFPSDHIALMAEFSFVPPEEVGHYSPKTVTKKSQKTSDEDVPKKPKPPINKSK